MWESPREGLVFIKVTVVLRAAEAIDKKRHRVLHVAKPLNSDMLLKMVS